MIAKPGTATPAGVVFQARIGSGNTSHHGCGLQLASSLRAGDHPSTDRVKVFSKHLRRAVGPLPSCRDSHPVEPVQRDRVQHVALLPRYPVSGEARVRTSDSSDDESAPLDPERWCSTARRCRAGPPTSADVGEMTTTGRFLTISGALKPVSKSHISSVPGFGWKVSIEEGWRSPSFNRWRGRAGLR